jgi:hypothetical protein
MCQRLLTRFLILTPSPRFSAMNSTPALWRLDIIFQPLAPSVVDASPFSRVAGYFNNEQQIISADIRFSSSRDSSVFGSSGGGHFNSEVHPIQRSDLRREPLRRLDVLTYWRFQRCLFR